VEAAVTVLGRLPDRFDTSRANLASVYLATANLRRANLRVANLREADLLEANLLLADLVGAILQGANLQWAFLHVANLQGANLQRASLFRANLQGADLQRAILRGAILRGADLRAADLRGANLQGRTSTASNCKNRSATPIRSGRASSTGKQPGSSFERTAAAESEGLSTNFWISAGVLVQSAPRRRQRRQWPGPAGRPRPRACPGRRRSAPGRGRARPPGELLLGHAVGDDEQLLQRPAGPGPPRARSRSPCRRRGLAPRHDGTGRGRGRLCPMRARGRGRPIRAGSKAAGQQANASARISALSRR
jgi:hypothetical protein